MAIGKNHASWFICYAKPYGMRAKRASVGLNYIKGPNSFLPPSPETGHLRFVVSDYMDVLQNELLPLRDKDGNPAIKLLAEKVDGNPIVEVLVPPAELLSACACCGKWESLGAPRFLRCSKCKARCYCSQDVCIIAFAFDPAIR